MSIPDYGDAPFHCPPDPMIGGIVIDLPPPLSVNKIRRINWREHKRADQWRKNANKFMLAAKVKPLWIKRFEIRIILDENLVHCDADNACKLLIDYLHHIEIIVDDSKQHMRKVTIEWGLAPLGARVIVIPQPTLNDVLQQAAERLEAAQ